MRNNKKIQKRVKFINSILLRTAENIVICRSSSEWELLLILLKMQIPTTKV